jgi:diguanylate cyclase (GGDEF)-like protein/PAS domain S-box-containing protein
MRSSYGSFRQSASSRPVRVLLLEDMQTTVAIVKAYLAAASSSSLVESTGTLGGALQMLERGEFDLVIADLNLPDCQGIETLERLVKETESLIVVLTIEESPQLREAAFALGAYDFLQKNHLSKAVLGRIVRLATLQANTFRSLRESEARFRSLTELSSDFYWETDASHRMVWTSHGDSHRPFGTPGIQIGKTPWETPSVSPDEAGWAAHRATLDAHQLFRGFEISRLDESGAERHTSVSGEPLFDDNGVFSGYRGVGREITEQKRAEEQAQRSKLVMDGSADMFLLIDRGSMRFIDVNPAVTRLLGYSREEMLAMGPQDVLPVSRAELEQSYDALIASPSATGMMHSYYRCKDGSRLPFESTRRVLRSGGSWIVAAISRDIRERIEAQQALRDSEARFRQTFELAGSGIAHVDLDGYFLRVNRSLCAILGYASEELVGRTVRDLSHPDDHGKTDAGRARVRSGELESARFQKRYLRKDGAPVWVDLTVAVVRDGEGRPLYEIAVFDDDTERIKAELALRDSAEELRLFADNVPAMTVSWDENLHCLFANKRYAEFFGIPIENILGRHVREILGDAVYREIEGYFTQMLQGHPVTYERTHRMKNGELRHIEIKLLPHTANQGRVLGGFSVTTDITEHKLAEERIQRVAHHDSLTGLPNRLLFYDRLLQAISMAKRDAGQIALLYLDLNGFKQVNDALGHAAGDELLQGVAARIRQLLRDSDTVARIGGDEFTVILPGIGGREEAEAVAGKITAAVAAPFQLGGHEQNVNVGTSAGIAVYPADGLDADALIKAADAAMYSAKQARSGDRSRTA